MLPVLACAHRYSLCSPVLPVRIAFRLGGPKEGTTVLQPGEGLFVRMDAVGGDFDFGNAAEGEQKLYEVLGWLLRSLFHNVGNRVGDRGLEHL